MKRWRRFAPCPSDSRRPDLSAAVGRVPVFTRYLGASGVALGLDIALFFACVAIGLGTGAAAALGYCAGIALHWWLSSRAVFAGDLAPQGHARVRQQTLFVLSALVGLALTTAIVTLLTSRGMAAGVARFGAVGVSFITTYLLRRMFVFG